MELEFSVWVLNILLKGSLSQIINLGPSLYFVKNFLNVNFYISLNVRHLSLHPEFLSTCLRFSRVFCTEYEARCPC